MEPVDDPKQWPLAKRWFLTMVVCNGALCVTCAASMVRFKDRCWPYILLTRYQPAFAELGISRAFHVSREVAILGITVYVVGLGM